jgi:haloalkane dehalogenase
MSMFGAQQMANFFRPTKAAQSFEQVTSATEEELDQALKQVFKMGDDVQRRMVDLLFGAFTLGGNGRSSQAGQDASVTSIPPQASQPPAQTASQVDQSRSLGWSAIPLRNSQQSQSAGTSQPAASGDETQAALPYEADISPDYPFQPHYIEVFGSRMHYIEQGRGEPIVFIHGNPTWSYLWRNILPHLVPYGRCIAVDLIGYGRSDKPHIQYKWTDQRRYVEEFFRKMGLKHVVLVLHDWGVSLGLSYAMRHESNVRAIAFMEGIFRPFPEWKDFSTPEFRQLFQTFRIGNEGGQGWQLLVDQNFFIEHLLSGGVGRPLDEKEMSFYREPFEQKRSRIPIWQLARSVPVAGEPKDVWVAVSDVAEKLKRSKLPKILFHAQPGGIITEENVEWCKQNLANLETVFLGPGVHYVQETTPHLIGRELARWYQDLGKGRREGSVSSAGMGTTE